MAPSTIILMCIFEGLPGLSNPHLEALVQALRQHIASSGLGGDRGIWEAVLNEAIQELRTRRVLWGE